MSDRLETLKKARERMIENRDAHAKVLAAPFDRDRPSGNATSSSKFRCWSTRWITPSAERKSFRQEADRGGSEAQHQLMHGYSRTMGAQLRNASLQVALSSSPESRGRR
jgi:hypothetical protein